MLDLIALFNELRQSNSDTSATGKVAFSALPIPKFPQHRIACDEMGAPTILLSVSGNRSERRPLSIALEHLSVQYDIECRISSLHGGTETGQFTIIRCIEADIILQTYFLRVIAALIESIGDSPSRNKISQAINQLLELFRALAAPSLNTVRGLWAELFLIAQSCDPSALIAAWHSTPDDVYDFCDGAQRIEVKSTGTRIRQHHFKLEQLRPPTKTNILVASLFVERAGGGVSFEELLDKVRSRIASSPELVFHLERTVGLTLGEGLKQAMDERFDFELAQDSLAFFKAEDIPSVNSDLPPGVSEIHFKSDLTHLHPTETNFLHQERGIFSAARRK